MTRRNAVFVGAGKALRAACVAALVCAGSVLAFAAAAAPAVASGDVMKVRLGGNASQTRIVIDLDRTVAGKLVSRDDDFAKSVIALPDVKLDAAMSGNGQGLITSWQIENKIGRASCRERV